MAKNSKPVKPVEPDTGSDDSTEAESDSEPLPSQQPEPLSSSDEAEEDSESDSDPTRKSSTGARKPRPMLAAAEDPAKSSVGATNPRSKPASAGIRDEPAKSSHSARKPRPPVSTGQRPQEENVMEGKKLKSVEIKSTPLRVWSEDDVLVILEGMIDYRAKNKTDPVAELDSFLHSIKENLHVDVTRRQLQDKVRKLQGKYKANKKKEKKGQEMILPTPHEQTAYELSKSIWGKKENDHNDSVVRRSARMRKDDDKAGDDKAVPAAKKAKTVEEMVTVNAKAKERVIRSPRSKRKGGDRAFPVAKTVEERVLLLGDKLFENEEQGEEWNKLRLKDMEIYMQHLEVRKKQTKLVIDSLKSAVV